MNKRVRVWSGNMWLDGNDANIQAINPDDTVIELFSTYPHKQLEIKQYIEIYDKHKKELCEDDIIKIYHKIDDEWVHWTTTIVYYNAPVWTSRSLNGLYNWGLNLETYTQEVEFEIIGNRQENPEMLDKNKWAKRYKCTVCATGCFQGCVWDEIYLPFPGLDYCELDRKPNWVVEKPEEE